ncbi:RNA-binding protein [Cupriavidus sp. SK-4]|uniref:BON domain-containing protein n=1 Tax=Cupriavidus sp. SK-4 TaxID=574750 RepID=UPI0004509443|nr:BON domain-containing protein [Cupriavidus sp. SK-4]EYS87990.1 RNA-binding protein [Cupriavidus sp. SK-4]
MGYYYDERNARAARQRRQAWQDDDWQPESEQERWQARRRRQQMAPGQTSYGDPARPDRDFNEAYGARRYPEHPSGERYGSNLRYGLNGGSGWERASEWRDPQAWQRDDDNAERQWRRSAERARDPRESPRGRGHDTYFSDLRSDTRYWVDPHEDWEEKQRYELRRQSPGYREYAQRRGWETDSPDDEREGSHGVLYNLGRRIGEAVGDWFGSSERRTGPRGYQRSDERIRDQICEQLSYARGVDVSDVSVDVSEGVVSLTGTVRDRGQKFYIEDLADGTYGVKEVNNDIRVRREAPEARSTGDVTGSTWRG